MLIPLDEKDRRRNMNESVIKCKRTRETAIRFTLQSLYLSLSVYDRYRKVIDDFQDQMDVFKAINNF